MTDLLDRLNSLRSRVGDLSKQQARRAADLDLANQRLLEHQAALKDQFGCTSLEEARAKLAEMEVEINAKIDEIDTQLEEPA